MNFRTLSIHRTYYNYGNDSLEKLLLLPAAHYIRSYKLFMGPFSETTVPNFLHLLSIIHSQCEEIQIIICCNCQQKNKLEDESDVVECPENIISTIKRKVEELSNDQIFHLKELIEKEILDFRFASTEISGIYRDQFGVLTDLDDNQMVFYGAPFSDDKDCFDKVRIIKGWIPGQDEIAQEDDEEFDLIWSGNRKGICVDSETNDIIGVIEEEFLRRNLNNGVSDISQITLRDYQEEAIQSWIQNNYRGFIVMATGTGKTWTAIYAAKKLTSQKDLFIVICAPYKHLIKQWKEDVKKVYPQSKIVLISGENHKWEDELLHAVFDSKYGVGGTIIAISTIKSFNSSKFKRIADKSSLERLLIVDEAHRFKNREEYIHKQYKYLLGLSATPFRKKNDGIGQELMNFFGGQVFDLPIEYAIQKGYLVQYNYYPIFVNATEDEEEAFDGYTRKMMLCFRNNICIDVEALAKYKRARLRVISMAKEKNSRLQEIIKLINPKNHFIVYCGDGKLFGEDYDEGLRHIQFVKNQLTEMGYKSSQFTADENMETRMQLVDAFNKGMIDSMVAIRCLDEGINIPSIETALIFSSNDDYREFVQRRGRILRPYKDIYTGKTKETADIYDVIVLPSLENRSFALIELRRFYEYARISINAEQSLKQLQGISEIYGITLDDLIETEDTEEEALDE